MSDDAVQLKCRLQETEAERDAIKAVIGKQKKEISDLREQIRSARDSAEGHAATLALEQEKSASLNTQLNQILSEREQADSDAQNALNLLRRLERRKHGEPVGTPFSPSDALDNSGNNFSFGDTDRQDTDVLDTTCSNMHRLRVELEQQVAAREDAEAKLQEESNSFELEANGLHDRLAEEIEKRAALKESLVAATAASEEARAGQAQREKEVADLQAAVAAAEARASALEEAKAAADAEREAEVQAARAELAEAQRASEQLQSQASVADAEVARLSVALQEAEGRAAAAEQAQAQGGEQLGELQGTVQALQAQVASGATASEAQLEEARVAQAGQAAEAEALKGRLAEAEEGAAAKGVRVGELEEAVAGLRAELAQQQEQQQQGAAAAAGGLEEERAKHVQEVARLAEQHAAAVAEAQAREAAASKSAASEKAALEESIEELQAASRTATEAATQALSESDAALQAKEAEVAEARAETAAVKAALDKAGSDSAASAAEALRCKDEAIATLQEKLAASEAGRQEAVGSIETVRKQAADAYAHERASLAATYRATLEKLKAKYEGMLSEQQLQEAPAAAAADPLPAKHTDPEDMHDMPPPLPVNLSDHKWQNVRSNFHFIRLRPQGVARQWRVHDVKMFDAEGTNICTDPHRMVVSGVSCGEGSDTCKATGYWEAPLNSVDNSWMRYDLPSSKIVWRVETRSSAEDGLAPLRLVLEGSRDGSEWVSVAWASGVKVKPQRVYHNGEFVQQHEAEVLHSLSLAGF